MKSNILILGGISILGALMFFILRPDQIHVATELQGRTMNLYGEPYTIKWAVQRKGKFQYTLVKPGITLEVWEGNPGLELQPTN